MLKFIISTKIHQNIIRESKRKQELFTKYKLKKGWKLNKYNDKKD